MRGPARDIARKRAFWPCSRRVYRRVGEKMGKFMQSEGGTIFLDEIGTASPSMQVKLLRILQDFEFEQVGGTKTYAVDTRVILATNEDLSKAVAEGRFRQDLFYRINVINVELALPPRTHLRHPHVGATFPRTSLQRHGQESPRHQRTGHGGLATIRLARKTFANCKT